MSEDVKEMILELLHGQTVGVISTVQTDKTGTESAVVDYIATENLEIIFGTSRNSRKYKNISQNPHVSFVVGWEIKTGSMQYEGVARELSEQELSTYIPPQFNHNQVYFIIKPSWIRLLHKSGQRFEISVKT